MRTKTLRLLSVVVVLGVLLVGVVAGPGAGAGTEQEVVYIATGENFPDALGVGSLAALEGAPILLVARNSIPGATLAELNRLQPSRIVIVGGTGVVSDSVKSALEALSFGPTVERLSGPDRYATAAAVSARFPFAIDADTLDGIDSTGFLEVNDKAADSDLLDGIDSTGFLGVNDQAADSDLLDGKDGPGVAYEKGDLILAIPSTISVLESNTINAPQDGFVIATGFVRVFTLSHVNGTIDDARLGVAAQANAFDNDGIQRNVIVESVLPSGWYERLWSEQKVYPVTAGSHTFNILGVLNTGSLDYTSTTLTLLWVPAAYGNVNTEPPSASG